MNILAFFTSSGVPATGLSPTVRVRDISDGSLVVTDAAMTETGDGFYKYDFSTYNSSLDYAIRCDGGITLPDAERYVYAGNEYVDAVWDEKLADHTEAGTFGHELATKADILASTSTTQTVMISGGVIEGLEDGGTYVSTYIRDGVYWIIEEDVSTGITVEFIFNLPSVDHRPGVFRVFGRYEGTPAPTHYQELWIYNYEATAWEQLTETFMPGGITSDETFSHEYYERHIDRTSNNEVRFRIIHNLTTYNASHHLYIDLAEITSIEVITAEDIADAVWSKTLSGGTAEELLYNNNVNLKRALGLMHENIFIDNASYDTDNNLIGARVRIYSDAVSVGTVNNVIGTYTITSVGTAPGKFSSWKQVKA